MRRTGRAIGLIVIAAILAVCPGERAPGFTYFGFGATPVVWAGASSIRYLSPTTFPPGSETDTLYLSAMGQWTDVSAGDFQYFFVHSPEDFPVDHFDGFNDTLAVPPSELDPGVLAVTFLVNSGADWFDADTLFSSFPQNAGWDLGANPDCSVITNPAAPNGFSFLLVSLHELGHALGLGHDPVGDEPSGFPWQPATMNPHYPMGGPIGQENIIELHADDRNGARFLYPHSGPSFPPFMDLGNASYAQGNFVGMVVPVFVSPSTAGPSDAIVARGMVENLGTENAFFVHQGYYLSLDPLVDTGDLLIGEITWDLAFGDAIEYDATIFMPDDLASGQYWLGSILDDDEGVDEFYEDNNAVIYCQPLTVTQLVPVIDAIPQETSVAGEAFTGPVPTVSHPLNMNPITWSLDDAPPGMTINPVTGVVSWADPIHDPFTYTIIIRATNGAGSSTQFLFLGVLEEPDLCPADCGPGGGDGFVNTIDLLSVLAEWGSLGPFDCDAAPPGGNGRVGTEDLLYILTEWGPCPP